jgi:CobQ/CobB/MinD/ParA family nucleotide binding protein
MTSSPAIGINPKGSVHFTLQGKGGVGKSLVSSILAQYFVDEGRTVRCVDTDPVNQTLSQYRGLGVRHLSLLNGPNIDQRRFDLLMEDLLSDDGATVVDNGASTFVPLSSYLIENGVVDTLTEADRQVRIHCVVTGGQAMLATLAGLDALAKLSRRAELVVWLNEFFGPVESQGKTFYDMKAYQNHRDRIRAVIRIPMRSHDTFGRDIAEMTTSCLTFAEVFNAPGWTIMARQRIRIVQRELYDQLVQAGL